MHENLKDILSHLTTDIDQETLLLYLQDKLPAEKKHEVEKKSYQEITETTGFTMLQVKSYIQNGKRNLKILIEKKLKAK